MEKEFCRILFVFFCTKLVLFFHIFWKMKWFLNSFFLMRIVLFYFFLHLHLNFFLFKWNFVEKRNKTKKNSFVQFISMDSLLLVTNKWQTSKSKMFLNHSVFFVCFPFVCLSFVYFRVKYHYHRHHITINFITHAKWIQYEFSMKNFCLLFFFSRCW